jgi:hypothetical protein
MSADGDDRIFEELMRLHEQRRRIYRRFIVSFGTGMVGLASCMLRRVASSAELGDAFPATGMLAAAALTLGMFDARDVRQLTARMQHLGRALGPHR